MDRHEQAKQNWRDCRRYLKRYAMAALLFAFALLWGLGYGQGLLDGYQEGLAARTKKESS